MFTRPADSRPSEKSRCAPWCHKSPARTPPLPDTARRRPEKGRFLAEVGVAPAPHAIAKRLQGAARSRRFDGVRAKCRGDCVTKLLDRATEDLAARLELGSEAKKTEAVVTRDVETGDELVEEHEELAARVLREAAEPLV